MRPFRGELRQRQIAPGKNICGIVGCDWNFVGVGKLFEFGCKSRERAVGLRHADQHTSARFAAWRAMQRLHFRYGAAGEQASDVNKFVGLRLREDALQAARAGALLHDEGDGESAFDFRGINVAEHFQERGCAETIANGSSGQFCGGQVH